MLSPESAPERQPEPEPGNAARQDWGYHALHRAGRRGWWRPALGVILAAGLTFLVVPLLLQFPFALGLALVGEPVLGGLEAMLDIGDPTPLGLAYLNVTLAVAIPVTWALSRWLHGLRPRWLSSVRPRLHWGYLAACLGLAVVALIAMLLVGAVLPGSEVTSDTSLRVNDFTATTRDFLLVIVLLTPLQAAGEEYLFRGYLTQAFGGLFGRIAAIVIPAVLFALAHGAGQSIPVFVDRLAFGLVAGYLVLRTGGLEAGIALHVINNWVAFGLALAFGDMASTLNATEGSWWSIPGTVTESVVYLALAAAVADRLRMAREADPRVLEASRARVYRDSSALPGTPPGSP